MNTYHKDLDKNGRTIYYKFGAGRRFVRASKAQVELEIATGRALILDYYPWKPVEEMTDRQLRACLKDAEMGGDCAGAKMARAELAKR